MAVSPTAAGWNSDGDDVDLVDSEPISAAPPAASIAAAVPNKISYGAPTTPPELAPLINISTIYLGQPTACPSFQGLMTFYEVLAEGSHLVYSVKDETPWYKTRYSSLTLLDPAKSPAVRLEFVEDHNFNVKLVHAGGVSPGLGPGPVPLNPGAMMVNGAGGGGAAGMMGQQQPGFNAGFVGQHQAAAAAAAGVHGFNNNNVLGINGMPFAGAPHTQQQTNNGLINAANFQQQQSPGNMLGNVGGFWTGYKSPKALNMTTASGTAIGTIVRKSMTMFVVSLPTGEDAFILELPDIFTSQWHNIMSMKVTVKRPTASVSNEITMTQLRMMDSCCASGSKSSNYSLQVSPNTTVQEKALLIGAIFMIDLPRREAVQELAKAAQERKNQAN